MENENIGEQPVSQNEKVCENENMAQQNLTQEGSPYGKFVNLQELKSAYENLEKEFTRKSQLLKEFQKNSQSTTFPNSTTTNQNENEGLETSEDTLNAVEEKTATNQVEMPCWEKDDWNQQVQDFLTQNPLAKNFASQISQIVLEDKEILHGKNPLQSAWTKFLEQSFKTPEQLLDDSNFFEKVKQNQEVKRAIIKDYVAELNNKPKAPPIFANSSPSGPTQSEKDFPKTLEEAKEWAKKIFSN